MDSLRQRRHFPLFYWRLCRAVTALDSAFMSLSSKADRLCSDGEPAEHRAQQEVTIQVSTLVVRDKIDPAAQPCNLVHYIGSSR
jgi:hypothetical protein